MGFTLGGEKQDIFGMEIVMIVLEPIGGVREREKDLLVEKEAVSLQRFRKCGKPTGGLERIP